MYGQFVVIKVSDTNVYSCVTLLINFSLEFLIRKVSCFFLFSIELWETDNTLFLGTI